MEPIGQYNARPRLLILVVAYNAEKTIDAVIARIPGSLAREYDAEILILDDASADATFSHSHGVGRRQETPFPVRVLFNARREGYGAIVTAPGLRRLRVRRHRYGALVD